MNTQDAEVKKVNSSIFMDKEVKPIETELIKGIGKSYPTWKEICDIVLENYPDGIKEWKFPGKKFGWFFRIKDKKRAIIYLLPRDKFFFVAFVFGGKAYDAIMKTDISEDIKTSLRNAKVYVEGRPIRIEVKNRNNLKDISQLIKIKLAF